MTPPVRFREDTGWEYRCETCARLNRQCFWPLTTEFWNRNRMRQCRACWRADDARKARERYAALPELKRARRREQLRRYRRKARQAQAVKDRMRWQRVVSDPELHERAKELGRAHTAAYRARKRAA